MSSGAPVQGLGDRARTIDAHGGLEGAWDQVGVAVSVLGFTRMGEKGDAVVRAEYLFAGGKAFGLRSSPV